ncbi:SDR family oxidoreductase [Phenylobacterium sp.]|uniref:SDR family oxidoreductase n=1 Tax=Phenylobacterium sp. TaxID=1871053 RepID=UPI0035617483
MKIVVIGATGRTGEKLVHALRRDDVTVVEASPSRGVNTITGEGLDQALRDATAVVDVSNSPSPDGAAALRFFEASGRRLLAAGKAAGVQHHIALSIVGADRLQASGYFRAKKIQEDLIKASGLPYSILRSTQFFEFIAGVVQNGEADDVPIAPALSQPISRIDVAALLADLATGGPLNGTVEVAGPERFRLCDLAMEVLTAYEDPRRIISDPRALYFGAELTDQSLLPGGDARIGALRFEDWLRQTLQPTDRAMA